jgi:sugar lactone lactonase YvrE
MSRRTAPRRRRRAFSLAVLGSLAALAPAPAYASWPGLNGWLSFSSNRFGTPSSGDIFAMPAFGLPQLQLTNARPDDAQSAWSPDGKRIAFKSRRDRNNELYVMNADGSEETRLTNSFNVSEGQPFWSPDGKRLLYRKTQDNPIVQNADIWQIDVNPANPNPRPVLLRPGDERYPAFSPDGTKIAFRGDQDLVDHSGDEELYIMNADGTNVVQLTRNDVFDSAPSFSPDGKQMVFESARDSHNALALDIYVMNVDGSNVRRLTADPAHDEGPVFSPDGTKILFTSERGGSSDIWVMNADGSGLRRLTDDPSRDESPDWQPVPFDTTGHVACGDVGLDPGEASSVVAQGTRCAKALRLAGRWAARAAAGNRPTRVQGFACAATPHTFDLVLVDCKHAAESAKVVAPTRGERDDKGPRDVAFVWRDPAVVPAAG